MVSGVHHMIIKAERLPNNDSGHTGLTGFYWFLMNTSGCHCCPLFLIGSLWLSVGLRGSYWSLLIYNGSNWFSVCEVLGHSWWQLKVSQVHPTNQPIDWMPRLKMLQLRLNLSRILQLFRI